MTPHVHPPFVGLALRELTPSQAVKAGRATILAGSRSSLAELFRVLAYTSQAPRPRRPVGMLSLLA